MNQLEQIFVTSTTGKQIEVTSEGSLGLLALGDIGLDLWRQAIRKNKLENNKGKEITLNKDLGNE